MTTDHKNALFYNDEFIRLFGLFMLTWNVFDFTTDLAIGRMLNVTDEQAHLITSGMVFGKKARLFRDLIGRSNHNRKAKILGHFNAAAANAKRDKLAHSMIDFDADRVTFLERPSGGPFDAIQHDFSLDEFRNILRI